MLCEWVVLYLDISGNDKLDNQVIELIVKILGRESQYMSASKLFDVIHFKDYNLDV